MRKVSAAAVAAEGARQRILADQRTSEDAEVALEGARRESAAAESELEAAVGELVEEVAAWSARWAVPGVVRAAVWDSDLAEAVRAFGVDVEEELVIDLLLAYLVEPA